MLYNPALSNLSDGEMVPHSKLRQNVSLSELIFEDRSLKSLADARSVAQTRQYFKF